MSTNPYLDLQSRQDAQQYNSGLGEVSQLVLATENSAVDRDVPARRSGLPPKQPDFGAVNLSKVSLGAGQTNTMDFIDRMIK